MQLLSSLHYALEQKYDAKNPPRFTLQATDSERDNKIDTVTLITKTASEKYKQCVVNEWMKYARNEQLLPYFLQQLVDPPSTSEDDIGDYEDVAHYLWDTFNVREHFGQTKTHLCTVYKVWKRLLELIEANSHDIPITEEGVDALKVLVRYHDFTKYQFSTILAYTLRWVHHYRDCRFFEDALKYHATSEPHHTDFWSTRDSTLETDFSQRKTKLSDWIDRLNKYGNLGCPVISDDLRNYFISNATSSYSPPVEFLWEMIIDQTSREVQHRLLGDTTVDYGELFNTSHYRSPRIIKNEFNSIVKKLGKLVKFQRSGILYSLESEKAFPITTSIVKNQFYMHLKSPEEYIIEPESSVDIPTQVYLKTPPNTTLFFHNLSISDTGRVCTLFSAFESSEIRKHVVIHVKNTTKEPQKISVGEIISDCLCLTAMSPIVTMVK